MSIFKYILNPFVEFKEPEPGQASSLPSNNQPKPVISTPDNTASKPAESTPSKTNDTGNFRSFFEKLIEDANEKNPIFQGTDIKEFIDTKVELDSIPDEATKIKTAFNVLKRTGVTKDKLLSTGQEYIKLIEHELAGIEGAFSQQYKNDVQLKEEQIQAKAQEIAALNDKISAIHQEISNLSQQVSQSKEQLTNNKNQFILAGQQKKSELESELNKINQYL
ncbi:hypothetical protein MUGA111182_12595 [Mucilaginibacter galii]|uniref:Uncharacterized protein n=1 Tax=Mucilaginibacter galii TaxID=2005073 RepID=A0A917JB27_9SPHI|nr:hypothetical protein [Mucilaginibacter galii]GGI51946.1 hypothetical protein GCM10011425_31580 [Mucilaginibacter galii]